jgi:glycosyltransferase involved in cell wall biosynthesis
VLAPFHLTQQLGGQPFDIRTVQQYTGDMTNILFVGGIKPNKGHARAIRVLSSYQHRYNERARLIFAGSIDERLVCYVNKLRQLAVESGVADSVTFTGRITDSQLKALYTAANVFLCTSEHEGFCVPLVEAMYFRAPIVAWGVTAVPETMGDCGILLNDWDEDLFAAHIAKVVEDSDLAVRLGDQARQRYNSAFSPEVLRRKLVDAIVEIESQSKLYKPSEKA